MHVTVCILPFTLHDNLDRFDLTLQGKDNPNARSQHLEQVFALGNEGPGPEGFMGTTKDTYWPAKVRSFSVGDVIEFAAGDKWACAGTGWRAITGPEFATLCALDFSGRGDWLARETFAQEAATAQALTPKTPSKPRAGGYSLDL